MADIRDAAALLQLFVDKYYDGNQCAFARAIDIDHGTISRAINRSRSMDIYSAAAIEAATKRKDPKRVILASAWARVKLRRPPPARRPSRHGRRKAA